MTPVRYFLVSAKTNVAHAYGCCSQTKARNVPIRLFDDISELEMYVQRPVVLCRICRKRLGKNHK